MWLRDGNININIYVSWLWALEVIPHRGIQKNVGLRRSHMCMCVCARVCVCVCGMNNNIDVKFFREFISLFDIYLYPFSAQAVSV